MRVLGLMSGTSLDGLDMAYVDFDDDNPAFYVILQAETLPYSASMRKKLEQAYELEGEALLRLHTEYGKFLGRKVKEFLYRHDLPAPDIVASHGQTVYHRPESRMTFQLGSGAHLAAECGIDTVCDFRIQDVALGGQGAPLVPVGDKLLFADYPYCLNLGGFANISFDNERNQRIAYDIVPANIVLNYYARLKGKEYDENGRMAARGKIHQALLSRLDALPYFSRSIPKSLGWEFVEEHVLPLIDSYGLPVEDVLRTYTEHIARQIGKNVSQGKMLVTGGGAFNEFLMDRIRHYAAAEVIIPDKTLVMFKEALIFALLGYLKMKNQINVLKSVTGAQTDHVAGIFYPAPPQKK